MGAWENLEREMRGGGFILLDHFVSVERWFGRARVSWAWVRVQRVGVDVEGVAGA